MRLTVAAEPDEDGDLVPACLDCDDDNATIFPGRPEDCSNGVDDDCSGVADQDEDADGDGFTTCDGDCDDQDPDRAPDQNETCDGTDEDCDRRVDEDFDLDLDGMPAGPCTGWPLGMLDCDDTLASVAPRWTAWPDADADGWGEAAAGGALLCTLPSDAAERGGDCDDDDPAVSPGSWQDAVPALAGDSVDWDCDGEDDAGVHPAVTTLTGGTAILSDNFGANVLRLPDLDGDGLDELLVARNNVITPEGNFGSVEYFSGSQLAGGGSIDVLEARAQLRVPEGGRRLGSSLAVLGDLGTDGIPEVLIGESPYNDNAGRVWLVGGATLVAGFKGTIDLVGAHIASNTPGQYLGLSVAGLSDIDGGGKPDFLVGGPGQSFVLFVSSEKWLAGDPTAFTFIYGTDAIGLGYSVAEAGDLDGGGTPDLLLGASNVGANAGGVYVVPGELLTVATPPNVPVGTGGDQLVALSAEPDHNLGALVMPVPDLDGDGLPEALMGAPHSPEGTPASGDPPSGAMYLVLGSTLTAGIDQPASAAAAITWEGTVARGYLGTDAAVLPAWAGGAPALALLEGRTDTDEPPRVAVFTDLPSLLGDTWTLDDGDYVLQDPVARVLAGTVSLAGGDFDGDGRSDLVVGNGFKPVTADSSDVGIHFGPVVP